MKFNTTLTRLKNNLSVTIRECETGDTEQLLETIKTYLGDSKYLPILPEEFNPTIEEATDWLKSYINNENSLFLIAVHEGKIIGNIDISGGVRIKLKHTAIIGMGMLKEWRNIGLGTALLSMAVKWARQHSKLELLWLKVISHNEAAIALYKKSGFIESGRQNNFLKLSEGFYADNVIMDLDVKEKSSSHL